MAQEIRTNNVGATLTTETQSVVHRGGNLVSLIQFASCYNKLLRFYWISISTSLECKMPNSGQHNELIDNQTLTINSNTHLLFWRPQELHLGLETIRKCDLENSTFNPKTTKHLNMISNISDLTSWKVAIATNPCLTELRCLQIQYTSGNKTNWKYASCKNMYINVILSYVTLLAEKSKWSFSLKLKC